MNLNPDPSEVLKTGERLIAESLRQPADPLSLEALAGEAYQLVLSLQAWPPPSELTGDEPLIWSYAITLHQYLLRLVHGSVGNLAPEVAAADVRYFSTVLQDLRRRLGMAA